MQYSNEGSLKFDLQQCGKPSSPRAESLMDERTPFNSEMEKGEFKEELIKLVIGLGESNIFSSGTEGRANRSRKLCAIDDEGVVND